jgi:hypothetical protein
MAQFSFSLLTIKNTKILKSLDVGYRTFGLHLAPHTLSGHNVCPKASPGCALACLNTAGRGIFKNIQAARARKTKWFFSDRRGFLLQLKMEINAALRMAHEEGLIAAFRLNLTSDIAWENFGVMQEFPDAIFYDYTKIAARMRPDSKASKLLNYHLTFSRSEVNDAEVRQVLAWGKNVAVVFGGKVLPKEYLGYKVISGDNDDLRFTDPKNCIVGLYRKGAAIRDTSGFVVNA